MEITLLTSNNPRLGTSLGQKSAENQARSQHSLTSTGSFSSCRYGEIMCYISLSLAVATKQDSKQQLRKIPRACFDCNVKGWDVLAF